MYETKSASVGLPSVLPMNSLKSGPIHGRTVSTMLVLTVVLVHLLSEDRLRLTSFGMLHVSEKMGKGQKKIRNFQFLGGW